MSPIATLLGEIQATLEGFVELLQQETTILSGRDPDLLSDLSNQKARHAETLNQLWSRLARGLGQVSVKPAELKNILLKQNDREALQAWERISQLGERANQINRHNGILIQEQLQHTTRAVEVLKSMAKQNNTYGPDGLTSGNFAFGRSIDKV